MTYTGKVPSQCKVISLCPAVVTNVKDHGKLSEILLSLLVWQMHKKSVLESYTNSAIALAGELAQDCRLEGYWKEYNLPS